ncbi:MAG: hypothetical protein JWQ58_350, partial [Reyranella sp.]|nr:hypothetical protein [Reyranella sp.]
MTAGLPHRLEDREGLPGRNDIVDADDR